MRVIATLAHHEIVDFDAQEPLPAPFVQGTGYCYKSTNHAGGAPGRTFIRTPLLPDTQIKLWQGLIDPAVVEGLLATDAITASEGLHSTVENVQKVTLACGLRAVFKPAASDDAFTGTHWAEIASYQVDRAIGLRCVPVTVHRQNPENGSIQLWVDGLTTMEVDALPKDLLFFDKLTANSDRGGNAYPNFKAHAAAPHGCVAFDNGCSFLATVTELEAQKEAIRPRQSIVDALAGLTAASFDRLPEKAKQALDARVAELRQLYAH